VLGIQRGSKSTWGEGGDRERGRGREGLRTLGLGLLRSLALIGWRLGRPESEFWPGSRSMRFGFGGPCGPESGPCGLAVLIPILIPVLIPVWRSMRSPAHAVWVWVHAGLSLGLVDQVIRSGSGLAHAVWSDLSPVW